MLETSVKKYQDEVQDFQLFNNKRKQMMNTKGGKKHLVVIDLKLKD